METALLWIYSYFKNNRGIFYAVFIGSFLLITFFSFKVKFEEDISKIIPKDKKIEKLNGIFQNSKFIDKLVIMVSLKDTTAAAQPDSLVAFAEQLDTAITGHRLNPYIKKKNFKVDDDLVLNLFQTIDQRLPVYLNELDYKTIDTLTTPEKLKLSLQYDLKTLSSPTGFALKKIIVNDPVGISFIALKKLQQLQYDKNFELYDNFVVTKDHKNLLAFHYACLAAQQYG